MEGACEKNQGIVYFAEPIFLSLFLSRIEPDSFCVCFVAQEKSRKNAWLLGNTDQLHSTFGSVAVSGKGNGRRQRKRKNQGQFPERKEWFLPFLSPPSDLLFFFANGLIACFSNTPKIIILCGRKTENWILRTRCLEPFFPPDLHSAGEKRPNLRQTFLLSSCHVDHSSRFKQNLCLHLNFGGHIVSRFSSA